MKPLKNLFQIIFFITISSRAVASGELYLWNEAPQFAVEINGKVDVFARVYQPQDYKPYLIVVFKEFKQPILMNLTSKEVSLLDQAVFKKKEEISVSTEKIPTGKKFGSYTLDKGISIFTFDRKKIGVRMKATLIGEVSLAMLLAHSPIYSTLRDAYKTKKASIDYIKSYSKQIEMVVMFATWCPTCKQMVPRLLRILKDANNPKINVRYIGIAMGGSEPHEFLEKYGDDYPAFIIFENGKEKGRIIGMTPNPLEDSIVAFLKN